MGLSLKAIRNEKHIAPPWSRRWHIAICSILMLLAIAPLLSEGSVPAFADRENDRELRIKAASLYYITKFISWPPPVIQSTATIMPLTICVLGKTDILQPFEKELNGKSVHNRPIVVERRYSHRLLRNCSIVFVGTIPERLYEPVFSFIENEQALSVSDVPEFAVKGGGIELYDEENRLRIKLNPSHLQRAGISVSAELLDIAELVGAAG